MPPRLRLQPRLQQLSQLSAADSQALRPVLSASSSLACTRCQYATVVTTTPAPSEAQINDPGRRFARANTLQPASHRDPKNRKSQLLRSYVSLLETTPLIVLFQHSNLKASEWVGIRRELAVALQKVDDQLLSSGADPNDAIGDSVKLNVIQTNIFEPALRIAEYYHPEDGTAVSPPSTSTSPKSSTSGAHRIARGIPSEAADPALTHVLSTSAYKATQKKKNIHPLTPLLTGSVALLNFPRVSPQHVKAALSILAPQAPIFPAPTRRLRPSYHELNVQDGLKKLLLLGARVDGQVFDTQGTRWVGSIDGGITGLRAQLVGMLQGFGAGVTTTLESASRSLWFTMEGRRTMLEEEANGSGKGTAEAQKEEAAAP